MVGGVSNTILGSAGASSMESSASGMGLVVALVGLAIVGVVLIGRRLVQGTGHSYIQREQLDTQSDVGTVVVANTQDTQIPTMTLSEIRTGTIDYLERQTATKLSHMTTKEVLDEVEKKIASAQYARVAQILSACDEGVYAKKQVANESLVTYYQELFKGESHERQ
jgi:predicted transcriptional regulator